MAIYTRWMFTAGRDSAVTLYNLGSAMEIMRDSINSCKTLNASLDQKALTESNRILKARFPRYEGFRHIVAHAAEFSQTSEKRAKHSTSDAINTFMTKPEGPKVFIGVGMRGREFFGTFKGKVIGYELSLESFEHVKDAILRMIEAFRPLVIVTGPRGGPRRSISP